jgi:hypothetical protein
MAGLEAVVQRLEQEAIVGDLWVDGSFMTEAIDPADVDVVLFVSPEFYDGATVDQQGFLQNWFGPYGPSVDHECHAFLACEFPQGHPQHVPEMREYWLRQYGTGHDEVSPKGIAVVAVGGGLQ